MLKKYTNKYRLVIQFLSIKDFSKIFHKDNKLLVINNIKRHSNAAYFTLKYTLKCKQASSDDLLCSYFNKRRDEIFPTSFSS